MTGDWPPLGKHLNDFGGAWESYQEQLYAQYARDFHDSVPMWPVGAKRFSIKRQPLVGGQCHTFWHIITEGDDEESRTPDLVRCERISWPRLILDEFARTYPAQSSDSIAWWIEPRGGEVRYHIALADFSYLVVVADRTDYVLLWTAFPIEREHQRRRKTAAYEAYWAKRLRPPPVGTAS
jgi:hypothetical protein